MSDQEARGTARRANVIDAGSLHEYFTAIPNIVYDMGLDPYEICVYGYLKRVAGDDGKCWQNTKTIAEHCKMSVGKVSEVKKSLRDKWKLIEITEVPAPRGGWPYHVITIVDI